ncbi:Os06g0499600 [Oryza sativa Japonica Group]|uniref:Os06g0499600 protein n=1 Tax=Oryza sativa subsp. japonica TaxID=39947 RepID=A0A0N7KM61_ORYSJ|nr:Os06g0499600 [Oryza sativa Japonica Group]
MDTSSFHVFLSPSSYFFSSDMDWMQWTTTAVAAKVDSSYGGRGRWQRCMHAVDELWRKNAPAAAAVDRGRGQGGHRRPGWTRNTATVEEGDGNGKGLGRWWPRRM